MREMASFGHTALHTPHPKHLAASKLLITTVSLIVTFYHQNVKENFSLNIFVEMRLANW